MSDSKEKPNKDDLLKDLEGIRKSLVDDTGDLLQESEIPLLTDSILDENAANENPADEEDFEKLADEFLQREFGNGLVRESQEKDKSTPGSVAAQQEAESKTKHGQEPEEGSAEYFDEQAIFDVATGGNKLSGEEILKQAYRQTLADAEDFLDESENKEGTAQFEEQTAKPRVAENEMRGKTENLDENKAGKSSSALAEATPGQQSLFDSAFPQEGGSADSGGADTNVYTTGVRKAIDEAGLPLESRENELDLSQSQLPQAEGENPFLPMHIRQRLHQGKSSFMEEIAQVSESLNRFGQVELDKKPEDSPLHEHRDILDALVAKYMPLIEAELREKLAEYSAEKELKEKQE